MAFSLGGGEEAIRDEVVVQLRQQLGEERRKHEDMKRMFENTIENMEQQNRSIPVAEIQLQATKAVDEIINRGSLGMKDLQD